VHHSLAVTAFYSVSAAALAKNWWPIIGWGLASGYMYWLYKRALDRAQASGSKSWDDAGDKTKPAPAASNGRSTAGYPWSA
jgi:hypothetical protein